MVKLGNFGLAVQLTTTCTRRNTTCGTSWYMAPEVYDSNTQLKSDVWSLGISLLELADGKNPFADCSELEVSAGRVADEQMVKSVCLDEPPSFSSSGWSPAFVDFVKKCLVKDVDERWSVSALLKV